MTEETKVDSAEPNYLDMSDEEFLKGPMEPPAQVAPVTTEVEVVQKEDASGSEEEKSQADSDEDVASDSVASSEEPAAGEAKKEEPVVEAQAQAQTEAKPASDKPVVDASKVEADTAAINYEAEYKKLIGAPFKANGKDFQVDSAEDAIQLMQMGANYNKKMAALKPNLKLMKLLENSGLLSEEKISFLIDVSRGDKNAVSKLIQDGKLDPIDLDAEKAGAYKRSTYTVDDRELALDTVLEKIKDSPAYTQTLDIVTNKWDAPSKAVFADQPALLEVINTHVESGIYDRIAAEVERERTFGRLSGLSDLEAYRKVGDAIHARGGFNQVAQGSSPSARQPATQQLNAPAKPAKPAVDTAALNDKRRAASSAKPAVPTSKAPAQGFNPLAMSDEEFMKQVNSKYL